MNKCMYRTYVSETEKWIKCNNYKTDDGLCIVHSKKVSDWAANLDNHYCCFCGILCNYQSQCCGICARKLQKII